MSRLQHDSTYNIRLGSAYLKSQLERYDGSYVLAIAAYNAGPHNARKWLARFPFDDIDAFVERIPYKATRLYVKLVLKNYAIYKALSNDA